MPLDCLLYNREFWIGLFFLSGKIKEITASTR